MLHGTVQGTAVGSKAAWFTICNVKSVGVVHTLLVTCEHSCHTSLF